MSFISTVPFIYIYIYKKYFYLYVEILVIYAILKYFIVCASVLDHLIFYYKAGFHYLFIF